MPKNLSVGSKGPFHPKMSNLTLGKDRHGGWSSCPLYYLRKLSTEKGLFIEETSGWWVKYVLWVAVVVPQCRVYWRQRRKLPHNTWQWVADRLWTRLYLLNTQFLVIDPFRLEGTLSLPLSLNLILSKLLILKSQQCRRGRRLSGFSRILRESRLQELCRWKFVAPRILWWHLQ